jgi:hypothetical protein
MTALVLEPYRYVARLFVLELKTITLWKGMEIGSAQDVHSAAGRNYLLFRLLMITRTGSKHNPLP